MHTTDIDTKHINGIKWLRMHHNGDWSGDVHICWDEEVGHGTAVRVCDCGDTQREVRVPGAILLAVAGTASFNAIRDRLLAFLEDLEGMTPGAEEKV